MDTNFKTVIYTGTTYKLRSGAPLSEGIQGAGTFYLHTFMAEQTEIDTYAYTELLPESNDFRGQFGDYMSANFSRINERGGNAFSGKMTYPPTFIEEEEAISNDQGDFA